MLNFSNITVRLGGTVILDGATAALPPGARVGMIGRNGAGKSTLISLVPRFHDPASGQVLIDGTDIASVTKKSLRQQLSLIHI